MSVLYYNLDDFGKKVRIIRQRLNLTQKEVTLITGVNIDTLRKIENGKVIPKHETLDLMSLALKEDLNPLLLKYRIDNYSEFHEMKNKIEYKLESGNFNDLEVELVNFKKLLDCNINSYFMNLINQLLLSVESVILKVNYADYDKSLLKLVDAMKITIPKFSLSKYKSFAYNNIELRILMNIALILDKIESTEKSLELLEFCMDMAEYNQDIYSKLCYNLSYTYHRLRFHEKSLYYSNLGIENCIKHKTLSYLSHLYFRKGVAEYCLGYNNYKESLLRSKNFSKLLGQNKLTDMLI
ncbi:helix-turn-helix domain-containing protein [Tissierella simiarum]|uniref:helix-turn-helix domain-containing protein n=1 Tax=Tissierella simiarum TaxID=2841534 RepID=UPI0031B9E48C